MKRNHGLMFRMNVSSAESLSYTLCHTHMHIIQMLMKCFSKTLQCNTGVLQIYPPKTKSRPEIYVPSVGKGIGKYIFDAATIYPSRREGGGNAAIGSSLIPRWLHLLNGFASAPCRILPLCSWSLSPSHPRF